VVGSNFKLSTVVCPGLRVTGNVVPETVKPVPVSVGALMVNGKLPVELKVNECVAGVFTATLPNATVGALVLRMRVAASNCRAKLLETIPALAVSVTACAV
jgi:hypothetical protein